MDKKQLTMLIMAKKTLDYQKDPNPDNWVTMKGSHVHLENGKIDGGAGGKFNGQSYKGTKKQAHAGKSTGTSSKKYESKARESVEYWVNTHYKNPSDKNIKESVDNVRSQMEHRLKTAERNLSDAKKTGKEELIKSYQEKYDEAKGTLEALNNYYDGGTVKKEPAAKSGKSDVGENGLAYLRSISHVNSSAEEETGYTARTMIDMINKGKTLEEIRTELRKNIDKYSHDTDNDYQHLDKMIEAVKRADKGEAKETKPAGNKDVRVKLPNGVTLRWKEVPGEPDKVYNPETHTFYHLKGGIEAAIEKAKSQGAEIEDYEKSPSDPYQVESKNRQDRKLARSAAATRRASKRGRPPGAR